MHRGTNDKNRSPSLSLSVVVSEEIFINTIQLHRHILSMTKDMSYLTEINRKIRLDLLQSICLIRLLTIKPEATHIARPQYVLGTKSP